VTENTPLDNPFWEYSRNKIACEKFLEDAWARERFPYTVVRPSHTFDRTSIPMEGGYTNIARLLAGKPAIVHSDGTSLWTLTHNSDFAKAFVGLLGNEKAIAQAFHITSDRFLTWNRIFQLSAEAFGARANLVHVPSEVIARFDPNMGASLLGDKAHCMIFDNSKVKKLVPDFVCTTPYEKGVLEIAEWYRAHPEAAVPDQRPHRLFDNLAAWAARD
jgi:nucleoside-diphosphate-sugar epimerase